MFLKTPKHQHTVRLLSTCCALVLLNNPFIAGYTCSRLFHQLDCEVSDKNDKRCVQKETDSWVELEQAGVDRVL